MRRAAAVLVAFLILSGCTREEARARLKDYIPADTIDIIHARFPCHSPDLHFFGYRFRVILKGEFGDGDICWNMSTRQWSWRILPGAESLAPQPSQLASALASTEKSVILASRGETKFYATSITAANVGSANVRSPARRAVESKCQPSRQKDQKMSHVRHRSSAGRMEG